MSDLISRIYEKIFGTYAVRSLPGLLVPAGTEDVKIRKEHLEVELVVMSFGTEREIMRQDFSNTTGILDISDKSQPRRIFGKRIAYDETLPIGEVIICGEVL